MEIWGHCDDRFASVRDAFEKNFTDGSEVGASVAVTVDGEPVVDLWAGLRGPNGEPWEEDTIVNVYSTTKTMAALCVLMCHDRGLLDVEAPVAEYWPEFAANGKEGVLVRHVMSHTAGLPGFDEPVTVEDLYDWDGIVERLAAQAPWWEPGSVSGYHAVTQGYLQGELVRRVTGRSIGTFFREEVAVPLEADFHIGLPESADHRVARLIPPSEDLAAAAAALDPTSVASRVFRSHPLDGSEPATWEWRAAEIPAAGGIGNARSIARVHAAMACGGAVDGVRLLSPETLERAMQTEIEGEDLVMGAPLRLGLGFGLPSDLLPLPNPSAMFWGGWGGSLAIIDLDARMSIAYAMNRMAPELMGDTRGGSLATAAYLSLMADA